MAKRLLIDLNVCDDCRDCNIRCNYHYRAAKEDHGILGLRELAQFALVCRRCENPSCVNACPFDALERQKDGVLKRYNLRCVSCKSCAQACPFGTIYADTVPFYVTRCDYCLGQGEQAPECVASCEQGALAYREIDAAEEDVHILNENLAVKAPKWDKEDV